MTATTSFINPYAELCVDAADMDAIRRGREYTKEDIDKFRCVRNFIDCAYTNIVLGLNELLKERIPEYAAMILSFKHGRENSDDNHSDTLDQLWWLTIEMDYHYWRLWFPCKMFWWRRRDIMDWFVSKDPGNQLEKVVKDIMAFSKKINEAEVRELYGKE